MLLGRIKCEGGRFGVSLVGSQWLAGRISFRHEMKAVYNIKITSSTYSSI